MIRWSEVRSGIPNNRAVATITQSAGSRQQESRIQIVESSILLDTIPWDMGMHDISDNLDFPLQNPYR